jgi:hypothetical protein
MQGLITERHFDVAERWFPGIRRFYLAMASKPRTFLELVWEYQKHAERPEGEAELSCIPLEIPAEVSMGRHSR